MLQTTETLIVGLAANDETRWVRFYRDYAPYIENALLKHTPLSSPDAEDVIHETLVALVALMPTYRPARAGKGAFHSFVLKIAQNKAYDLLRRRTRAQNRHAAFAADPAAGPGTLKAPLIVGHDVYLVSNATLITSGILPTNDFTSALLKRDYPTDASGHSLLLPAFHVEPGSRVIFTENPRYPQELIDSSWDSIRALSVRPDPFF